MCKASDKSPPTNQHPAFYRPYALPVTQQCQSTDGCTILLINTRIITLTVMLIIIDLIVKHPSSEFSIVDSKQGLGCV